MDEQKKSEESQEESLASVPPNPYEPPVKPLAPLVKKAGVEAALFLAAGTGALFLLGGMMLPAVGATRSAKLKWGERQLEIEQAEIDAQAGNAEKHD
ncbi:MAG TPA: hypothetical protein VGI40_26390 [Pirellulaceae bacterium]|jgi:hypothetical protein